MKRNVHGQQCECVRGARALQVPHARNRRLQSRLAQFMCGSCAAPPHSAHAAAAGSWAPPGAASAPADSGQPVSSARHRHVTAAFAFPLHVLYAALQPNEHLAMRWRLR